MSSLTPPFLVYSNGGGGPPQQSISGETSPREYLNAPLVVVTASMYNSLVDARFLCGLESCEAAAKYQVPAIVVDDSPQVIHEQVKTLFEEKGRGWVRVAKFRGHGKKAASIRQALSLANKWRQLSSQRWVAVFTEFEKVDLFQYMRRVVQPILDNEADIVTPTRDPKLFEATYASEQFHSESLGNTYLNMVWRKEGGQCDLDWLFGPICWEGSLVSPFYLESNEESWDAQIVPSIRATRTIGARWSSVKVPYRHHRLQREEEEGSLEYCEKRMLQLNLMANVLTRAMTTEGRLPVVIVAGAAGNLGIKIVQRLMTTTAADFLNVPLSSRPSSPSNDNVKVMPTKFRIILMDARECPTELKLTNFHGHQVEYLQCDFAKFESSWVDRFKSCYVAFLLAAKNPFPEATSQDAYASMVITSNLLEACANGKVERVIYASSNHLVGGLMKETGKIAPGEHPNFGTKYSIPGAQMDSTLYAAAKAAGEAQIRAMVASGRLNRVVILRIGWCQPGENDLSTISVTGTPTIKEDEKESAESKRLRTEAELERQAVLRWFRGMHLKNEDLDLIVDCCVAPGLETRPNKLIYANAMSDYPGQRWIVQGNDLGYVPATNFDVQL